jgi:hypothetical protein
MNNIFFATENTEFSERFFKFPKRLFSTRSVFSAANFLLLFALSCAFVFAQETGGVKGKIRTTKGDAISGATVTARLNGDDVKSVKSDAKGSFTLEGLKSGIYNVVFEKNGYGTGIRYNVEIKSGIVNDLGERLILTVDPGTQIIVKGSVFDKNGRSIYGAKIEIQRINPDGSTKKVGTGYTSESGEFTFKFPEASAKFRVIASMKGAKGSKDIEVESASIYRLAISLDMELK